MRPIYNTKPFSKWLRKKLVDHDLLVYSMAKELRIAPKTIYYHLNGEHSPTFAMVVMYCWYFNDGDDPREIWQMIEEG